MGADRRRPGVRARTWCSWSTGCAASTPASGPRGGRRLVRRHRRLVRGRRGPLRPGPGRGRDGAARVGRGLFTASPSARDVEAGTVRYAVHRVSGTGEASKLPRGRAGAADRAGDRRLRRGTRPTATCWWWTVRCATGGICRARSGYIKTQQKQYLPAELTAVVDRAAAGPAHPGVPAGHGVGRLVVVSAAARRAPGAPWSGIVRVECSADLTAPEAIELADLSAVTLPRFASAPYKDPRAPAEPGADRRAGAAAARHARRRPAVAPRAHRGGARNAALMGRRRDADRVVGRRHRAGRAGAGPGPSGLVDVLLDGAPRSRMWT